MNEDPEEIEAAYWKGRQDAERGRARKIQTKTTPLCPVCFRDVSRAHKALPTRVILEGGEAVEVAPNVFLEVIPEVAIETRVHFVCAMRVV